VIFSIQPTTGAENVLYSFLGGNDGAQPMAALVNFGGVLYGTTSSGGSGFAGVVFKFNPSTKVESVLHAFSEFGVDGEAEPWNGALVNFNNSLYGTTYWGRQSSPNGAVFKINPATGNLSVVYSFDTHWESGHPNASLINGGGVLYGSSSAGGDRNAGMIFKLVP
jgi:uncharacterized repeat protein (TIGR03803 family)